MVDFGIDPGEGRRRDSLIVIAGRPGMGKTALAMQTALGFAERTRKTALVFAPDPALPANLYVKRILAQISGIDIYRVEHSRLNDGEKKAVEEVTKVVDRIPLLIDDSPDITAEKICEKIGTTPNLGLVVIDPADEIIKGYASLRRMRSAARRFRVPVICCFKAPRRIESRKDMRPQVCDLEPEFLRRGADAAVFLYRESYYDPLSDDKSAEISIVVKGGKTRVINAVFDSRTGRFDKFG